MLIYLLLTDPYVKIYLLFNKQRITKKKTHVKKRTLNPVFNESFVFDLPKTQDSSLDNIQVVRCFTRTTIFGANKCKTHCTARVCDAGLGQGDQKWGDIPQQTIIDLSKRCYQSWREEMNPQVIGKLELGREGSEGSQLHHWTEIQVSYFSLFCTQIQLSSCLS